MRGMPASPSSEPLITPEVAAFLESGLSITIAGCGERRVPSIAKAVGCSVSPDRRQVTLLLFAPQAERLCLDVARNGRIACCFSLPSTHETLQLKGIDGTPVPATAQDLATARRELDQWTADLMPLGWGAEFVDGFFWGDAADLVALRFTPVAAFEQTPGPAAGTALGRPA